MNIKDFQSGQEVFGLTERKGRNVPPVVRRLLVAGVGRKYVKAAPEGAPHTTSFALASEEDEYLTEARDWGDKEKLFPSEQALQDYQERNRKQNQPVESRAGKRGVVWEKYMRSTK